MALVISYCQIIIENKIAQKFDLKSYRSTNIFNAKMAEKENHSNLTKYIFGKDMECRVSVTETVPSGSIPSQSKQKTIKIFTANPLDVKQ